jgi:ABC-type multidrug transport system fused ATPase/permease subunit
MRQSNGKADFEALSQQVERERKIQAQVIKDMERRNNSLVTRLILLFTKNRHAFLRDEITLANLPDLPLMMNLKYINLRIENISKTICENKRKYEKRFKNVTNLVGLYDFIVWKLIEKEVYMLRILEIMFGGLLALYFVSYSLLIRPQVQEYGSVRDDGLGKVGIHVAVFLLSTIASIIIFQKEEMIKLLIKLGISQLVYQKLTNCDIYFLDNADNNLIYKLMYSELEDYCKYNKNWMSSLPILISFAVFIAHVIVSKDWSIGLIYAIVLLRVLLSLAVQILKKKSYASYKNIIFEQRKIMYEFIHNFKGFTLKNLKPRYMRILTNLRSIKDSSISRIQNINNLDRLLTKFILYGMLVYKPIYIYYQKHFGDLESLLRGSDADYKRAVYYSSDYFMYFVIIVMIEPIILNFTSQIASYQCYLSTKGTFDRFFDNDHVIDRAEFSRDKAAPGQIIIKNCDVLERDKTEINDSLGFILKRSSEHYIDYQALFNPEEEKENKPQAENAAAKSRNYFTENFKKSDTGYTGKLKLVCSRLSLNISPGSKVCIYDNGNTSTIKGFIYMLLRENYLHSGEINVNGSISYFNAQKMHFLVGKTIRDNILFGNEFKVQRYETILKYFGSQFSNYHGQDLFQVSENARNIKTEDQRTILLARFIYQESDIYIIDDYFKDLNLSIMMSQISFLFNAVLKDKTVIFVSSKIDMIRLSTLLICFESDRVHHIVPTKICIDKINNLKGNTKSFKTICDYTSQRESRVQILQTKVKNTLFVANITFEEELMIHKKVERQKAEITKILQNNKNGVPEILAYGVYLTQKKREEGKALDDQDSIPKDIEREILAKAKKLMLSPRLFIPTLLLSCIPTILYAMGESMAFWISVDYKIRAKTRLHLESRLVREYPKIEYIPLLLGLIGVSFLLDELKNFKFLQIIKRITIDLNLRIQDSILDSDIRTIQNKKSHRILDNLNKDLINLETQLPILVKQASRRLLELLIALICVSLSLSLMPVIVFSLFGILCFYLLRKMIPAFCKINGISNFMDFKIDDLNFQLLSIISCCRASSQLDAFNDQHTRAMNNLAKISNAKYLDFKVMVRGIFYLFALISSLTLSTCYFACINYDVVNWLNLPTEIIVWGCLSIYRYFSAVCALPPLIFDMLELKNNYVRIEYFVRYQKKIISSEYRQSLSSRFTHEWPIVFKNVSLTLGLQPIIKKISFRIGSRSRVGIIGIDGGGRTTLFELITNVRTRDFNEGSEIRIFGLKIESIEESQIKKSIFFLERDPKLFEGSVWENLDPYNEYEKKDVISKLRELDIGEVLYKELSDGSEGGNKEPKLYLEQKINLFEQYNHAKSIHSNKCSKVFLPEEEFLRKPSKVMSQLQDSPDRQSKIAKFTYLVPQSLDYAKKPSVSNLKKGKKIPAGSLNEIPATAKYVKFQQKEPTSAPHKADRIIKQSRTFKKTSEKQSVLDKRFSLAVKNGERLDIHEPNPTLNSELKNNLKLGFLQPSVVISNNTDQNKNFNTLSHIQSPKENFRSDINLAGGEVEARLNNHIIENFKMLDEKSSKLSEDDIALRMIESANVQAVGSNDLLISKGSQDPQGDNHKMLSIASLSKLDPNEYKFDKFIAYASKIHSEQQNDKGGCKQDSCSDIMNLLVNDGEGNEEQKRSNVSSEEHHDLNDRMLDHFLDKQVGFEGKNICKSVRQLLMICRAVFAKPKILLLYEDCLQFGRGIEHNMRWLSNQLPDSTIVSITKTNDNFFLYDRVLFMDGGKILEKGNPKELFNDETSFLNRYLKETDRPGLERLNIKLEELSRQEILMKEQDELRKTFTKSSKEPNVVQHPPEQVDKPNKTDGLSPSEGLIYEHPPSSSPSPLSVKEQQLKNSLELIKIESVAVSSKAQNDHPTIEPEKKNQISKTPAPTTIPDTKRVSSIDQLKDPSHTCDATQLVNSSIEHNLKTVSPKGERLDDIHSSGHKHGDVVIRPLSEDGSNKRITRLERKVTDGDFQDFDEFMEYKARESCNTLTSVQTPYVFVGYFLKNNSVEGSSKLNQSTTSNNIKIQASLGSRRKILSKKSLNPLDITHELRTITEKPNDEEDAEDPSNPQILARSVLSNSKTQNIMRTSPSVLARSEILQEVQFNNTSPKY